MPEEPIQLVILTERTGIRNDERTENDIVVEIRCKKSGEANQIKKALNLCIVIDRSGSMSGGKLEAAKKSCIDIFQRLGEEDLFTVVVFDDEAQVVVNPQVPRANVVEKINQIAIGGQTNLSLGWYLGHLELQTSMTERHNNRLLLLSDGQANQGETKRATLAKEAARFRDIGITTSTIGIGDDFQEDILEAIATESGGRFWYIQESRIEDILDEEFEGALSVVIDRPRLGLQLPKGARISKDLNDLGKQGGKYRIRPLKGVDTFNFAVRVETDPREIQGDSLAIKAVLYDNDEQLIMTEQLVPLCSAAEYVLQATDPIVKSVVQQYEVTVSSERALQNMDEGKLDLMKKMLMSEVGGMRIARDALLAQREEEEEQERAEQELRYLTLELSNKGISLDLIDMIINYKDDEIIKDFMRGWRKVTVRRHHKMKGRHFEEYEIDEQAIDFLLRNAVDLFDGLIRKFPDRREELEQHRKKFLEHLERRK
jgi:Ca-activated chloride channel homolog